jgi:hypothetical protein
VLKNLEKENDVERKTAENQLESLSIDILCENCIYIINGDEVNEEDKLRAVVYLKNSHSKLIKEQQ